MNSTTDVWFASYLKGVKGYELSDVTIISKGKGKFHFNISDEEWTREKLNFNKSDINKIKLESISLRDLIY